jgi:dTDP-4-dehydrorhamnose reductase
MKYVVLGAAGQLGRELCALLQGEVAPLTRAEADLTSSDSLRSKLSELRPEVILNCAAYNLVDRAESEPEAAFAVNTWGVRALALVCRELNCTLVHFSTDHVFGLERTRSTPYRECDAPGPVSVYGLSKLAGEYCIRSIWPRHFIFRTCGLYGVKGTGGKGGNFVETMLHVAGQGKPLRVVADQYCTPTYTADLARASCALLQTNQFGLYQLTNGGSCSWYEFARTIFDYAGVEAKLEPISSLDYNAAAQRPGYSVLDNSFAHAHGIQPLRAWPEALQLYLNRRAEFPAKGY